MYNRCAGHHGDRLRGNQKRCIVIGAWSHCDKFRKNLRRFGSPWLPAARRQIRIKKRAAKKPAERALSAEDYSVIQLCAVAFLKCMYLFCFLMKWTDELEAVLEVMFQALSLRGVD